MNDPVMTDLHNHLDRIDRDELEQEHRNDIESTLVQAVELEIATLIDVKDMASLGELCEQHGNDFDTIISLMLKADREIFMACFIHRNASETELKIMAGMMVYYFDFEQQINEKIELENDLAEEA